MKKIISLCIFIPLLCAGACLLYCNTADPKLVAYYRDESNYIQVVGEVTEIYDDPKYGITLLSCRLHTNIGAVVCVKPISEAVKIGIVGRKAFLLVVRLYSVSSRDNRSHQKGFVNVYTTANRINNFQNIPPRIKIRGKDSD